MKPKFKVGDKVKVNEIGKIKLLGIERDGEVTKVVNDKDMPEGFTKPYWYLTTGKYGYLGTWEEYLEGDD